MTDFTYKHTGHYRRMPLPKGILTAMWLTLTAVLLLTGCRDSKIETPENPADYSKQQLDSISFASTHHYSQNYNFVVKSDSLTLLRQQPEELLNDMMTDSVTVFKHDHLVVADIRIIPADPTDSVWVQVARDQLTFGWVHESSLLSAAVPSDPISQFISVFSDTHLLIFLIIISIISVAYLMRTILRRNAKIVHLNDINSFYPTLLALIVASSATLYSSIQLFAPETWQHYYFHPTLNPFTVPPILAIFIASVWAMLIVALAVTDVVRHILPAGEGFLYMCGLAGICAINYIVFSITTLYYAGYILFAAYCYFALYRYFKHSRCTYLCGSCGTRLSRKGRCPACGTLNG